MIIVFKDEQEGQNDYGNDNPISFQKLEREKQLAQQAMEWEFGESYYQQLEQTKQNEYLDLVQMNKFEQINKYKDKFPLLFLRKKLWTIQQ